MYILSIIIQAKFLSFFLLRAAGNICNGRYRYINDLLAFETTASTRILCSQISFKAGRPSYPRRDYVRYLVERICNGVHIGLQESSTISKKEHVIS